MDEMRAGIGHAWSGAVWSAKRGLRITKSALRSIPVDRLRVPGVGGRGERSDGRGSSRSALRRLFQLRYGAQIDNERGERVAAVEASDVESEESETLTDEQVHELVDKKYFERSYEAMKEGVELVTITNDGNDMQQRQVTEAVLRELRQKCDVVSATLKKRVLANRKGFVSGVEEIRRINDRLLETSSDCKKGRNFIRRLKGTAAENMKILAHHRRRGNCKVTLSLLDAMQQLRRKRNTLLELIEGGNFIEAVELLRQHSDIEQEKHIQKLHCMCRVIDEWKEYRDNKKALQLCQEASLTECLTAKFIPSKYLNIFEASSAMGTADHVCRHVAQTLWQSAVRILTKSLTEVSEIKDEGASIADIAAAIHPDHLMLCICQMCAKLMDFLFLFAILRRIHNDGSCADHPFAALHASALQEIVLFGKKLGKDLVEKIDFVLEKSQFDSLDVERVLHIFFVVSLLVEGMSVLGLEKMEKVAARTQVKASLVGYITRQFQEPKATQVLHFMAEDAWVVDDVDALDMNIVVPLHPDMYRHVVKSVKAFLAEASIDTLGMREDNPFYAAHLLVLQDTSCMVRTELFREEVARRGEHDEPSLLTSSAVVVANIMLEYVARIVVRFPPLAAETLVWLEDLIALYVYTVADNFVSISRAVRLEHQGDLSELTQEALMEMHAAAARAARLQYEDSTTSAAVVAPTDEKSGEFNVSFPPRVWGSVLSVISSQAHHYGIINRAVATQSCVTLVRLLEVTIHSVAPLLPPVIVEQRLQRCSRMKTASEELLHVVLHRLSQALLPMEGIIQSIRKLRGKEEVQTNVYVRQLIEEMIAINAQRRVMPTPMMEQLFLKRLIFAVQATLLREYCKLAKKKLSGTFIMQILVDVQSFQQQVAAEFGKTASVLPNHLIGLVKASFLEGDAERLEWVKAHHATYSAADLVQWFSSGDRAMKLRLEETLQQVGHRDAIPVAMFR